MKTIAYIIFLSSLIWQITNAQVQVSQIEGYLEVYHPDDTTSIYLGKGVARKVYNGSLRNNTFVGFQAGHNDSTGKDNAFFGQRAGLNNIVGSSNAFFGMRAGRNNKTGSYNSFFGRDVGFYNLEGSSNSFFGHIAGFNTNGSKNSFFGGRAGYSATGSSNTFVGYSAGRYILGDFCISLGANSGPLSSNDSYRLYIDVERNLNPLIYGEFDNDLVRINGTFNINEAKDTAGTIDGHIAQIYNTSTGTSPDVLALKVGTIANPDEGVNFITFYHGNDVAMGRIEGNGSGGVVYETSGADYAEYLPEMDHNIPFQAGDLVGVHQGKISHITQGASQVMVITDQAAVLGNMPDEDQKDRYQPVSFIGQIPVRVKGPVQAGDWIVPDGYHNGIAIAVPTSSLTSDHQIVGRAWERSDDPGIKRVNTAVGLDHSEAWMQMIKAQQEINQDLQRQIDELKAIVKS